MSVKKLTAAFNRVHQDDSKDVPLEDLKDTALPPAVPAPPYQHAAPSGPWPWMDVNAINFKTSPTVIIDQSWVGYPQNQFGNWTSDQVHRSQMLEKCSKNQSSAIYWIDVLHDGSFISPDIAPDMGENGHTTVVTSQREDDFWNILQGQPFFFTSSINWIPSYYQEAPIHGEGDRKSEPSILSCIADTCSPCSPQTGTRINTQAHYPMGDQMLVIDLLTIHMVRGLNTSTIISYHPDSAWRQTSAKHLHSLMQLVGGSVYWQKIFSKSKDPTFVFLAILWYGLYAWDESFELLDNHVSDLESQVLKDYALTRELHVLQVHLLHYQVLLHSFEVSVTFIEKTQNPAMESSVFSDEQRIESNELMKKECQNLVGEIDRLEKRRMMLSSRLKNATDLAYASVNLEDSRQTRTLTEETVRDSAAMKQSVFGMNVAEINPGTLATIPQYVETTISLTLLTVYIIITLQTHSSFHKKN
ncbi:uncharacterized protein EDB91DRAFT_1142013, partial [Suillus paluster]|uniref:uncharacterized protein n=1 Tax=Suillus paluster TaxID=48578 RepID=UPI001B86D0AA